MQSKNKFIYGKEDFKFARLYNPKDHSYHTNSIDESLIFGPETQKRYDENDGCAVTVCCITYKHEDYIRQALDGFVCQKTNFKFKVFVGEDCGPDGTADIIREYAKKYPDIIVPFIREENMGAQTNLIDLCNHANSPYIAFCEGDDFWIDEYKLQKQFDYMQEHEDIRMCYTNTEILAPEDWHLNSYYRHNKDGKMIIPYCTPDFINKPFYYASDFVKVFPNHTSSAFYRWNYDLDIPEWYFRGLIGDTPITILQMGQGKATYLPDVTSVYRRSDVGVFMNASTTEHFLNTRLDYVRLLSGLREYFLVHFGTYADWAYRARITKEIANYLRAAKDGNRPDLIGEVFETFPKESFEALHTFLGSYNIYTSLQRKLNPKRAKFLGETKDGYKAVFPGIQYMMFMEKVKRWRNSHPIRKKAKKLREYIGLYVVGLFKYWKYTSVPKEKNLWVFSGFRHNCYLDNCMYFYEYIVANHKEINAIWLTTSPAVYKQLKSQGMPVERMDSVKGKQIMSKAEIAVTDHFVMSDYTPVLGLNDKTKIVQLWHGVGFKSMGDENGIRNTDQRGVRYSDDILIKPDDDGFTKLKKKIKYFFKAPYREKFEKYFMFVCPGQERIDMIGKVWHIDENSYFMAGHPRDLPVYSEEKQESPKKIMYAPTYRFNAQRESKMVQEFLEQADKIQELMEKTDGEFYLRMHPHTWRNYKGRIMSRIESLDRVFLHDSKDVYNDIGTFSVLISDYSSIALDFALLDRPVIFHGSDYEWFVENEAGFNLDFPSVIPGPMTSDWKETLEKLEEYIDNPTKDSSLRKEKLEYFFTAEVNGPDNSERIVQEIKKRINL